MDETFRRDVYRENVVNFRKVQKRVEWYVRWLRLSPRILMQYGTLRPERSRIPGSSGEVHIDISDRRAVKRILFNSVRGRVPLNVPFWVDFVGSLRPDLAIDVGANYGECVFSTSYDEGMRAFAFEANPKLQPYLKRSLEGHPSRHKIFLVNALVDDRPKGEKSFFVHKKWSGGSMAFLDASRKEDFQVVHVPTVSVDSVVEGYLEGASSLVFKVDVEGFEPQVIQGMQKVLRSVSKAVGLVEIDVPVLQKLGWTLDEYDELLNQFRIFIPSDVHASSVRSSKQKGHVFKEVSSLREFLSRTGGANHFDMLLIKQEGPLESLPDGWELQSL